MSNWQQTIRAKSFYHDDSLTIGEKAQKMAKAIKEALPQDLFEDLKEDIYEEFLNFSATGDEEEDADNFNFIMNNLYDWSNATLTWVETF